MRPTSTTNKKSYYTDIRWGYVSIVNYGNTNYRNTV